MTFIFQGGMRLPRIKEKMFVSGKYLGRVSRVVRKKNGNAWVTVSDGSETKRKRR